MHHTLEWNQRIFVSEEGDWIAKGRYREALADDEDVEWSTSQGKNILYLYAVSS